MEKSDFIEKHYVKPDLQKIVFPKQKKNLIFVMVESLETSYQDEKNGGLFKINYITELTNIAKQNISFSASDKIQGALVPPETGWTIAATVAQTAGIPLKLYGTINTNNQERYIDNSMGMYKYFLPGAITLGDILLQNGYKNYFILGTDADFAGKSDYLKQHGNYEIIDNNVISKTKENINDKELFAFIPKKLLDIAKKQPFSVIIQTNDTHFGEKINYIHTSKEVSSFIKWLEKQPFFKDTVIVVVGDHCNMHQKDFKELETQNFRYNGNIERKVYNAFINSSVKPQKMTYRNFSIMDMFPTILAAMGATIEGNQLGLGVNLFSDKKTLLETYGPVYMFEELKKKSNWYYTHLLRKNSD